MVKPERAAAARPTETGPDGSAASHATRSATACEPRAGEAGTPVSALPTRDDVLTKPPPRQIPGVAVFHLPESPPRRLQIVP